MLLPKTWRALPSSCLGRMSSIANLLGLTSTHPNAKPLLPPTLRNLTHPPPVKCQRFPPLVIPRQGAMLAPRRSCLSCLLMKPPPLLFPTTVASLMPRLSASWSISLAVSLRWESVISSISRWYVTCVTSAILVPICVCVSCLISGYRFPSVVLLLCLLSIAHAKATFQTSSNVLSLQRAQRANYQLQA